MSLQAIGRYCCLAASLMLHATACQTQRVSRTGGPEDTVAEQHAAPAIPPARSEWEFLTVDSSDFHSAYICSVCVGADGKPHLFYQGRGKGNTSQVTGDFVHAFLHEGNWKSETVDSDCSVFGATYPALSRSGSPHLLYQRFNSPGRKGLKYVCRRDNVWKEENIYNKEISEHEMERRFGTRSYSLGLMVNRNFCFTVDRRSRLHACYLDPERHTLVYGIKNEEHSEWRWEALEDVGPYKFSCSRIWPSIAASPSGEVFVAYKKYQTEADGSLASIELRLATLSDKGRTLETIAERLSFIDGSSTVACDAMGSPHVAYCRAMPTKNLGMFPDMSVVYATRTPDGWRHEPVRSVAGGSGPVSLASDSEGIPYMLFADLNLREGKMGIPCGDLMIASRQGAEWIVETVAKNVSRQQGFVIDAEDCAHIVFSTFVAGEDSALVLRYGKRQLGAATVSERKSRGTSKDAAPQFGSIGLVPFLPVFP